MPRIKRISIALEISRENVIEGLASDEVKEKENLELEHLKGRLVAREAEVIWLQEKVIKLMEEILNR